MKEMQKIRKRLAAFKAPNARETWMDVQVRAYIQAWELIKRCM